MCRLRQLRRGAKNLQAEVQTSSLGTKVSVIFSNRKEKAMNFLDLFAGIGGFRLALERAGHTCVGFCEKDKYARRTYKANFNTTGEWEGHDITKISDDEIKRIGKVDLICGGFPCQAFSVAGKRRGFDDTRGTLFFEIARFARMLKPSFLLFENVKGLLSHDKGRTFRTILSTLDELGYDAEWQVCNSKDYIPQNRERVFIIGYLRGMCGRKVFPFGRSTSQTLKQITPGKDACRVYDPSGAARTLKSEGGGGRTKTGLYLIDLSRQEPKITKSARCIQSRYAKGMPNRKGEMSGVLYYPISPPDIINKAQNNFAWVKDADEPMFTLTIQDKHGAIIQRGRGSNKGGLHTIAPCLTKSRYEQNNFAIANARIRKLTPLECFRLQTFPGNFYHRAKAAGLSDTQLYKQAGNSVTVDVVYAIASRLDLRPAIIKEAAKCASDSST